MLGSKVRGECGERSEGQGSKVMGSQRSGVRAEVGVEGQGSDGGLGQRVRGTGLGESEIRVKAESRGQRSVLKGQVGERSEDQGYERGQEYRSRVKGQGVGPRGGVRSKVRVGVEDGVKGQGSGIKVMGVRGKAAGRDGVREQGQDLGRGWKVRGQVKGQRSGLEP